MKYVLIFVFDIKHLTDVTTMKGNKWGEDELTLQSDWSHV